MAIYKICPGCGHKNLPNAMDCASCGMDLMLIGITEEAQAQFSSREYSKPEMGHRCRCGVISALSVINCPACGKKLSSMPFVPLSEGSDKSVERYDKSNNSRWRFVAIGSSDSFLIKESESITIGSEANWSDMLRRYSYVSRSHADLTVRNGILYVIDHSTNGTQINFKLIPPGQVTEIPDGAEVGFGGRIGERQSKAAYFTVRKER